MSKKRILFVSGSVGLGHVIRDLAIVNELRKHNPDLDIYWLAAPPATDVIKHGNEKLLPEADQYANENISAESAAKGTYLNLIKYILKVKKDWSHNVGIFKKITERESYDLIIGDETYELSTAFKKEPQLKKAPFVLIYDFIGLDSMTKNPMEKLGVRYWNKIWSMDYGRPTIHFDLGIFIGEPEDVPDKKFGFRLPNRREYAKAKYQFVGYILPFEPADYKDKAAIRKKLGYGKEPLVICAIGGTAIGKELIELCGQTYPIIKKEIPNIRMILVCGPSVSKVSLNVPQEIDIRGYISNLYEHFAASDLAVVQGGGTSTLELTALRRPFLYFPLEGHCEQQLYVAARLARHRAGLKMKYSETTPELLAEKMISHIGKKVTYAPIPTDGAKKAAQLIFRLL
jgi:UDP-N-acetylglucosamine:LPS N-acetylglucosamine transferase